MSTEQLLAIVIKEIKFPCYYDQMGQLIMDQNGKRIADIRGWGWIQKLGPDSDKMQDTLGEKICELINSLKP